MVSVEVPVEQPPSAVMRIKDAIALTKSHEKRRKAVAAVKKWRKAHPDREKEHIRTYEKKHSAAINTRMRAWRAKNKARVSGYSATYRTKHRDKYNAYQRAWQARNRAKVAAYRVIS